MVLCLRNALVALECLALAGAAPVSVGGGNQILQHGTKPRNCGTHPSGHKQHESDEFLAKLLEERRQKLRIGRAEESSTGIQQRLYSISDQEQLLVPIKFLVMHDGNVGKVSQSQVDAQIKVMDEAFAGAQARGSGGSPDTRIRFKLESVQYVNNRVYYKQCEKRSSSIQRTFVKDPERYVYVIVCHLDYLGASTLPEDYPEDSTKHYIQLLDTSLPGGTEEDANLGDTLVHEIGHYFGLEHTFEKGCSGKGDYVADTPAVKRPNNSCKRIDSCPNKPGYDQVENFMDYTPDSCMDRFTPGQVWRMRMQLNKYKPGCVKRWSTGNNGVSSPVPSSPILTAAPSITTEMKSTLLITTQKLSSMSPTSQYVCGMPHHTTGNIWEQNRGYATINGVCAASSLVSSIGSTQPKCHHRTTHTQAVAICKANGARLCSMQEIRARVTKGTGCGIDNKFTWTNTACGSGKVHVIKGSGNGQQKCMPKTRRGPSIRCCADNSITTSSSSSSSSTSSTSTSTAAPVTRRLN